ncbi:BON domain-containing protein [Caldimonas brevitalea]|uniref:BON domain-containing protein n=1 Tax=Caldimonas brevitalea TaxID=413882 RepID=A0A0G3BLM3_9BURK|nr:BON domain-containing protein [Caldimonas brevitalea]AKJ30287.1 hypothetical protein AAW51_3596 [Caldimonas brevitalea]
MMKALTLVSTVAAAVALTACERAPEDSTAAANADATVVAQAETAGDKAENAGERAREAGGQAVDTAQEKGAQAVDATREKGAEVAAAAREKGGELAADAKEKGSQVAANARETGGEMAARASDAVSDAAITASVNAELARADDLSALRIDVDTTNGRVTLSGTAPSDSARERATQLASSVRGVTGVDNQLQVKAADKGRKAD